MSESKEIKYLCPACQQEQYANGFIAWCENAHIYDLEPDDPRKDI